MVHCLLLCLLRHFSSGVASTSCPSLRPPPHGRFTSHLIAQHCCICHESHGGRNVPWGMPKGYRPQSKTIR
ncbi:hypothetical protein B0T22DRAFT_56501 [Podospora appendiculata]|uniref:Secreted protein n=1 Tax=Podospora appendiculata TaxID=314037 RepID=A0AAE0XIK1_9PEZI|nr:hypothetical protein B0T22DRAFT_56501 [Podospora appendiculata]